MKNSQKLWRLINIKVNIGIMASFAFMKFDLVV